MTTAKIKLPWRRFGDEKPEMGDTSPMLLLSLDGERMARTGFALDGTDGIFWDISGGGTSMAYEEDRWMYLEELQNPYEGE